MDTMRKRMTQAKVVAGFDGFIDTLARPVRQKGYAGEGTQYFRTKADFGRYLIGQGDKSCSVELEVQSIRRGGNTPLFSEAMSALGAEVSCIGMLGAEEIRKEFASLPCTLYSYAEPGSSTCLEFEDGKVFLAPGCTLPERGWNLVERATGGKAAKMIARSDLTALLNWSELDFAQEIWQGVYDAAAKAQESNKARYLFFDLCDCARKSKADIEEVLCLIAKFSNWRTAILSLNRNEAHVLAQQYAWDTLNEGEIARALAQQFGIDQIVIHTAAENLLYAAETLWRVPVRRVAQPKKSTGAGDNFNAAYCLALLQGMEPEARLRFAGTYAGIYVQRGKSPQGEEILQEIERAGNNDADFYDQRV